ncbi:MAG TPA: serine/threonine-protein kinase [Gemmatimonadaceae bacterium]|nr:serine/threonine-protein kinase [Gemmatimonadaceae bacterium]
MSSISDRLLSALGGSYTIERELTGGGMALVFVGEDHDLGRKVVIKILPPELAASVSAERFRREILTVARLQHPHIVPILKAGEVDGLPYFVMPYVDGESIDIRLRRTPTFTVRETLGIMKDVARALAFAHAQGVVHRDIKPGNVLLAAGSATVTDFGVAKALSSARRSGEKGAGLTNTGMSLGTILYMAPEQAAGDPDIDGRADIYSLGITVYEMLAGTAPFAALGPRAMLTARLTLAPPPLSRIRKDVPAGLERLIARCLAIDPADRPQTAAELVEALEDPETLSGSFASSATRMARRGSRVTRAVVGALALVGAIVVSAGIYERVHTGNSSVLAESTVNAGKPVDLGVIAVLPFVNLGADSSNGYLATGVTNAVAGKLMQTPGLRVLAPGRPRSVKRRSDTTSTATVAARLVLEGTVERVGDRLRVTARLSSTDDDVMQWADVFDRDVKDIFTVEDEIAGAIAASVRPMTAQRKAIPG